MPDNEGDNDENKVENTAQAANTTATSRSWDESFQALLDYKEKTGDPHVPSDFPQDRALAAWCRRQRTNQAKLSEEQLKKLKDIGFAFDNPTKAKLEAQWNANFEKLKVYHEEHGDCNKIPKKYAKDPSLGSWAHDQKSIYKRGGLTKERQEKLQSIGFELQTKQQLHRDTTKNDEKWHQQYQKLVAFKEKHGHANCPQRYSEDKSLGIWVDTQRQQWTRNLLKEERKKLMDDIGFVWKRELKKSSAAERREVTNLRMASTATSASNNEVAVQATPQIAGQFQKLDVIVTQLKQLEDEELKEFEQLAEKFLEEKRSSKKRKAEEENKQTLEESSPKRNKEDEKRKEEEEEDQHITV